MKSRKMLGHFTIAAATLMVFAGTASASALTSPAGAPMAIGATLETTASNIEYHGPFTSVSCKHAVVKSKITQNGTKTTTDAGGENTALYFTDCSSNMTTPKKLGTFEINKSGEVFWTGLEFATHTSTGECVFSTNNTKIGTLTGGTAAVLDITATIPRTGGSFFCGSSAQWTGNYSILSPAYLAVH